MMNINPISFKGVFKMSDDTAWCVDRFTNIFKPQSMNKYLPDNEFRVSSESKGNDIFIRTEIVGEANNSEKMAYLDKQLQKALLIQGFYHEYSKTGEDGTFEKCVK